MLEKMQELIADQLSVDADSITEYDFVIPTDDLESINTVGDVINFLKEKGVE